MRERNLPLTADLPRGLNLPISNKSRRESSFALKFHLDTIPNFEKVKLALGAIDETIIKSKEAALAQGYSASPESDSQVK